MTVTDYEAIIRRWREAEAVWKLRMAEEVASLHRAGLAEDQRHAEAALACREEYEAYCRAVADMDVMRHRIALDDLEEVAR